MRLHQVFGACACQIFYKIYSSNCIFYFLSQISRKIKCRWFARRLIRCLTGLKRGQNLQNIYLHLMYMRLHQVFGACACQIFYKTYSNNGIFQFLLEKSRNIKCRWFARRLIRCLTGLKLGQNLQNVYLHLMYMRLHQVFGARACAKNLVQTHIHKVQIYILQILSTFQAGQTSNKPSSEPSTLNFSAYL